jgi:hypothetical protein
VWQFYQMAAGGSRERPSVMLSLTASAPEVADTYPNDRAAQLRDVLGSRLLLPYRAAELQSGSPPGAACLPTFLCVFDAGPPHERLKSRADTRNL